MEYLCPSAPWTHPRNETEVPATATDHGGRPTQCRQPPFLHYTTFLAYFARSPLVKIVFLFHVQIHYSHFDPGHAPTTVLRHTSPPFHRRGPHFGVPAGGRVTRASIDETVPGPLGPRDGSQCRGHRPEAGPRRSPSSTVRTRHFMHSESPRGKHQKDWEGLLGVSCTPIQ